MRGLIAFALLFSLSAQAQDFYDYPEDDRKVKYHNPDVQSKKYDWGGLPDEIIQLAKEKFKNFQTNLWHQNSDGADVLSTTLFSPTDDEDSVFTIRSANPRLVSVNAMVPTILALTPRTIKTTDEDGQKKTIEQTLSLKPKSMMYESVSTTPAALFYPEDDLVEEGVEMPYEAEEEYYKKEVYKLEIKVSGNLVTVTQSRQYFHKPYRSQNKLVRDYVSVDSYSDPLNEPMVMTFEIVKGKKWDYEDINDFANAYPEGSQYISAVEYDEVRNGAKTEAKKRALSPIEYLKKNNPESAVIVFFEEFKKSRACEDLLGN